MGERYCTHCGQENVQTRESFGHLLNHFFADLTHYDSKFFVTLKDLLFRPGFLTREYREGRRVSYLHPIRLYVFISALYFLLMLATGIPESFTEEAIGRQEATQEITDSLRALQLPGVISQLHLGSIRRKQDLNFTIVGNITYKSLLKYDSVQKLLPPSERDWGPRPWVYHHWLAMVDHYGYAIVPYLGGKTLHSLSKLMFLLLPVFALLLKLFYDRKKYFYGDHAIFALHFHSALFLIFLVFSLGELAIPALAQYTFWAELILAFIYLFFALRYAYMQSFAMTLVKTILIMAIYLAWLFVAFIVLVSSFLL